MRIGVEILLYFDFLGGECFRDENVILLSGIFLKEIVK